MGLHTEQDVEEVCEQVIEARGTRALTRERVRPR